ncbi:unnamed protein product [Callosobruchus maculatus]|uniref:Uncharacterized protein n=1 Tax=Callosobruchus maculatus TaxID=64391 RepID=A0A653DVI8_CALMS|nr:unnamed protein product [Callosobruchus maculatus]
MERMHLKKQQPILKHI